MKRLGLALVHSLFVYVLLAELIAVQNAPFEGFARLPWVEIVRVAFYVAAVALIALIMLFRRALLRKSGAEDLGASIQKLRVCAITTYALCEVPALLGLVLVLLNGLYRDFYALTLVSLLLFLVYFPRYGAWAKWVAPPRPRR